MSEQLGVHPRTVIRELRFYRLRQRHELRGVRVRQPPTDRRRSRATATSAATTSRSTSTTWTPPSPTCARTASRCMGEPVASAGASAGQRWVYFRSPWGMQFELVSFPEGKAYEADAAMLLWHPATAGGVMTTADEHGVGAIPRRRSPERRIADGLRAGIIAGELPARARASARRTSPSAVRRQPRPGARGARAARVRGSGHASSPTPAPGSRV